MTIDVRLRDASRDNLPIFFQQQSDPDAVLMVDPAVIIRSIVLDDEFAGHVLSYADEDTVQVSYWIGKEYWGRGLATRALSIFLAQANTTRPLYARVAADNARSRRV